MPKNRKAAEEYIIKYIDKLLPNSPNAQMYKDLFAKMSDNEFDKFMRNIASGEETLCIVAPNMMSYKLDITRNLALAKELGHDFFKRIWLRPKDGGPKYLTPKKHLVYKLPLRRQAQLLIKKISIPKDNNTVDIMTGQPTGDSKGGKVSYMELQILSAMGLNNSIKELVKIRGGDEKGFHAFNTLINRQGSASLKEIDPYSGTTRSTETLRALLISAHLDADLPNS